MKFSVITLLPELFEGFLAAGVIGRAVKNEKIGVSLINPRDFTSDIHRTVDDRPFGGGPGMVMKAEPLIAAITAAKQQLPDAKVVYLSPQGTTLNQALVRQWMQSENEQAGCEKTSCEKTGCEKTSAMILIAGRYEGIDERVINAYVDQEISIGDFVLSGGEIAAMAVIDTVSRLTPGVLGHPMSAVEDSFGEDGLLDHPHYTRPEVLVDTLANASSSNAVPSVLTSGDHKAIAQWRRRMALKRTWERRPDLLAKASLSDADSKIVKQLDDANDDSAS